MCKIIAIANRKGGVGKTTTALCFSAGLIAKGFSVLLVDLDQQHNSTRLYGARSEGVATVYDLLTCSGTSADECIQSTDVGDIIAGDDWMVQAEDRMARFDSREYILADSLKPIQNRYDFIVIDSPPSLGNVVKNILVAADEVIVPVLCDAYSDESFSSLKQQIDAVRDNPRLNPDLKIAGILVTQYEAGRTLAREYDRLLPNMAKECGTQVYATRIRRCEKVRQAQRQDIPLFDFAPTCSTSQDYRWFVDEYLQNQKV